MRTPRLATGITTLALLFGPVAAASAQEAPAEETTESTESTQTTDEAEQTVQATPSSLLAALLDMLAEALVPVAPAADDAEATSEELTDEAVTVVDDEVVAEGDAEADPVVSVADQLREILRTFLTTLTVELEVTAALAEVEAEELEADDTEADDTEADEEADEERGQIVRTVAHCAPNGQVAKGLIPGVKNHGQLVRLAAHGEAVVISGADPDSGDLVSESFDLATQEGADAFCALLDLVVAADAATADEDEASNAGQAKKAERNADDEGDDLEADDEAETSKGRPEKADKAERGNKGGGKNKKG